MAMNTTGRRDFYNSGKVPKVVRVNAGRDEAVLYKNLGNAHRVKFLWAETTITFSGSLEVVSSGTFGDPDRTSGSFPVGGSESAYGRDSYFPGGLAGKTLDDLHVWATPLADPGGYVYVDVNISDDTVTVYNTGLNTIDVDVLYFTT